ncbi:glycerate 2-kinase [Geosmithia morbida]|uniref:Glycerate 2-kinase n=1 Tax=Geosmithia morbida TaxID=1094350 RepID=A0A9P4Z2C9_9HYPO|nr:glycerate 2-kinase [Geosmithia morbida]KAF4125983.1 glycerate 2-kinase [Geosmithia morbida]
MTIAAMPPSVRVLVCPSGFKGSLQPGKAADCIEAGILSVEPNALVRKVPLVDGGEGFTQALVAATKGTIHNISVTGPIGKPVESFFGILGQTSTMTEPKTAVIEMAAAAGLSLVPPDCRKPGITTTYGVGQLILAAIEAGAQRLLVGCGDSGTCDGGAGMLQALGARLIDRDGYIIPEAGGGESLIGLSNIDLSGIDSKLRNLPISAAVNWHNVLCGPRGVAAVFGPQKGATEEQIARLSTAMDALARVAGTLLQDDNVGLSPGSGASGGLGTGLRLIGTKLRPRYDLVMEYLSLEGLFDECDLVLTAEGGIDNQTPMGKIPGEIARRAKKHNLPVIAIAGTIGTGARVNYTIGIDAYACILQRPTTLERAVQEAERLTTESAESVMRLISIGRVMEIGNGTGITQVKNI